MSPKHRFGMKIRVVLPLVTENGSFIAYYVWKHPVSLNEFMDILFSHEPVVWVPIFDTKIPLEFLEIPFHVDLETGTYDLLMAPATKDTDDKNYLTNGGILDRIFKSLEWQLSEIPKESPEKITPDKAPH
ncbi:hypothetical protein A2483_01120 [Candidatus Peregrinibacteria bacterium RIFOXYC2_FULL_33_13]|nr:MAG: hypothetical protein A2483_01120 [Candidatus Peregrinibacteria bacterium RIFOXYC2_FULL_33_13]